MKRRSFLLLFAAAGCHRERGTSLALSRALSDVAHQSGVDDERVSWSLAEMARLVALAQRELAARGERSPASVLSSLIFGEWGFVREVEDTSLRYVLLPSVLQHRRGSCVGLGSLFLALSEALGWSASGVLMPGHFYARVREANGTRNVELLRAGEAMPNDWYERRFPVPGGFARQYARPLTGAEVLGVVHYDVGNERRRQRRWPEAQAAYLRATRAFPDFSEAHASLGAVQQLLGDLPAATASYRRARDANPYLPGVAENLSLLEAEHPPPGARP
ncbi:MAG TPA: transglutaminase family protein [Polyangiaceae bacterium]|nr:transglutaminase family protein [Polyangiaceae bacterium]